MTTETITWHAVTDCLPDKWREVLMCRHEGIAAGVYVGNNEWSLLSGNLFYGVTHWADMPKGPRPVVDLTAHVIGVPV